MEWLQALLLENHRYAVAFRHAHEIFAKEPNDSQLTICLLADPSCDHCRYNLPTASEVAVVIPEEASQVTESQDIVLHWRAGPLQCISDMHRSYACLHYVLFFPYGEDGWHCELQVYQPDKQQPNCLSQIQYGAFRLFPHQNEFSTIL
jgi:hypothetical protein